MQSLDQKKFASFQRGKQSLSSGSVILLVGSTGSVETQAQLQSFAEAENVQ